MLTHEQQERYSRQILLDEIGPEGQERLLHAKVLIIGAGGLGSPAAFYLAAAGVGTIGIADGDQVELSNLQRQILHGTSDIGRPKVYSAREKMASINPEIIVLPHHSPVTGKNIGNMIETYDFVVDATDNFPSRFLINDTCVRLGIPYSHGGVLRFLGQAITVLPHSSPCYRCIFPEPPPDEVASACCHDGILGVVPGIIGAIQAAEAIKYLTGIGELLTGRLLTFDALRMRFREVPVSKNPRCPACA
ncbi:MAG: HesA/MoeB/ThiF family protein, partial [Geobacteraceae bacterium]|nr:HesA/MoeB/ThiF family protein [Geobacteraceae bacterium]